uniref:Uncharacterized protein n=1 Tax=Seriola dumerili TaxID=41447 RepID=A0A3B4UAZ9_SERDU
HFNLKILIIYTWQIYIYIYIYIFTYTKMLLHAHTHADIHMYQHILLDASCNELCLTRFNGCDINIYIYMCVRVCVCARMCYKKRRDRNRRKTPLQTALGE